MTDLHADARRVLELAQEERTPSAADKARIEARLALTVGAAALATSAVTSGAGSAAAQSSLASAVKPAGAALKLWLSGSLLLTAATLTYVFSGTTPAPAPVSRAPIVAPLPVVEPTLAPVPVVVPAPAPEAAPVPEQPALAPQPHKPARRTLSTLPQELELLHSAQTAWRARDARQALSLVKTHRARYPRSSLALERDALQVLSLCELGRQDEASALARKWLARAPRSPLRASIEQSCALR